MPFIPESTEDALSDIIPFLVAPITTVPTAVYSAAAYVTDDYPLGKPDWGANLRNAVIWTAAAGAAYGWNYFLSPHNATWVSGGSAYKAVSHLFIASSWAAPAAAATVMAAVPTGLFMANRAAIQAAPEEQRQSLWQVFSQGLTGTGPGVGGWTP